MPAIVFYVSGHGFGHAIRQIEIISALLPMAPADLRVVVRTNAPEWLFTRTVRGRIALVPGEMDTGVVQIDGLRPDERGTVERARAFYETLSSRAEEEAARLETEQAGIVISDAPPLACAAAKLARIPSVVCANFTWDWIYSGYGEEAPGVDQLVSVLRETYALAEAGWRLPMHGGFESFDTVVDVPFVARHSRADRTRRQIREALHLPVAGPLALASFGGYGIRDLPIERIDCLDSWGIVITAPDKHLRGLRDGVHAVSEDLIYGSGLRYEDLVRAVDVVVTKPGYGIISDCLANDTAILYTSRGRFAEYDVLVREMPRVLRCEFLARDAFLAGRWKAGLDGVVARPAPLERPSTDGAQKIARMILDRLGLRATERSGNCQVS